MSLPDLPPLPRYLRDTLAMPFSESVDQALLGPSTESRQGTKQPQSGKKKRRSVSPKNTRTKTKLDRQIEFMRNEMIQLKAMDKTLLEQFYALHENIQEFKQVQDKISETTSECSSASYNLDAHLETIPDYREHIYVNEKFHTHVYENVHIHKTSFSDAAHLEKGGGVYEPMYLQPQCQANNAAKENVPHSGRQSKSASAKKSDHSGSQSKTVPADRKSSSGKFKKQSSKRHSGLFTQTTYESSC